MKRRVIVVSYVLNMQNEPAIETTSKTLFWLQFQLLNTIHPWFYKDKELNTKSFLYGYDNIIYSLNLILLKEIVLRVFGCFSISISVDPWKSINSFIFFSVFKVLFTILRSNAPRMKIEGVITGWKLNFVY